MKRILKFLLSLSFIFTDDTSRPRSASQQDEAEQRFEYLAALTYRVQRIYAHIGKVRKRKSERYGDHPHERAVEKHGDEHPAAGAESEIRSVRVRVDRRQ